MFELNFTPPDGVGIVDKRELLYSNQLYFKLHKALIIREYDNYIKER